LLINTDYIQFLAKMKSRKQNIPVVRARKQIMLNKDAPVKDALGLDIYFRDIMKYEPLTTPEEKDLFARYKDGDLAAREKIIKHNLKFVVSVAKYYQRSVVGIQLSDLIAFGNIGLMKAIERYDATLDYRFISFAVWWIRQPIIENLRTFNTVIDYPQNFYLANVKIKKFIDNFYKDNQREPSDEEVYTYIENNDLKVTAYSDIFYEKTLSLDTELYDKTGNPQHYHDIVGDTIIAKPDEFEADSATLMVRRLVSTLPEREKGIIMHSFGIDNYPHMSLDDIAEKYEVSSERIRQIKRSVLSKMKENAKKII
jgi:RNA polymerase primary sigma factor